MSSAWEVMGNIQCVRIISMCQPTERTCIIKSLLGANNRQFKHIVKLASVPLDAKCLVYYDSIA